jgi:nitrate/nitrite-specific signal transduction histidine kinase
MIAKNLILFINLTPFVPITFYRGVRQVKLHFLHYFLGALNNIKQNSEAANTIVVLTHAPQSLKITAQYNGKWFSLSQMLSNSTIEGHLSLIGIEQRARALNSTLNINFHPDIIQCS